MATIFMSMSGEGRGHATRICSITEMLKAEHQLVLFAPADAYQFLSPMYAQDPQVRVVEIPGLVFHYVNGKLALGTSIYRGFQYLREGLDEVIDMMCEWIEQEQPELIVTDFEPALPRAATRLGIPFISFTHQHFLVANDLAFLPWRLKWHAWSMSWAVRSLYSGQMLTIISSFFHAPLRPEYQNALQVGPMIRPEIRHADVMRGDFYLSYLRKKTPPSVVDELVASGLPIRVYGIGEHGQRGNVTFHPVNPQTFSKDLASCRAIICAAGNQLLGESLFLGKPIFAMPEAAHHEQQINSQFLTRMGCGRFVTLENVRATHLVEFAENHEQFREAISQRYQGRDGTQTVVKAIRMSLGVRRGAPLVIS